MLLQRLATTDWFTSRLSACGLFATAYPRSPSHLRADLRQLYGKLCRDDTPMVRRAAAFRLGNFAETMEPDLISKELIPLFQDLTQDGEAVVLITSRLVWNNLQQILHQVYLAKSESQSLLHSKPVCIHEQF